MQKIIFTSLMMLAFTLLSIVSNADTKISDARVVVFEDAGVRRYAYEVDIETTDASFDINTYNLSAVCDYEIRTQSQQLNNRAPISATASRVSFDTQCECSPSELQEKLCGVKELAKGRYKIVLVDGQSKVAGLSSAETQKFEISQIKLSKNGKVISNHAGAQYNFSGDSSARLPVPIRLSTKVVHDPSNVRSVWVALKFEHYGIDLDSAIIDIACTDKEKQTQQTVSWYLWAHPSTDFFEYQGLKLLGKSATKLKNGIASVERRFAVPKDWGEMDCIAVFSGATSGIQAVVLQQQQQLSSRFVVPKAKIQQMLDIDRVEFESGNTILFQGEFPQKLRIWLSGYKDRKSLFYVSLATTPNTVIGATFFEIPDNQDYLEIRIDKQPVGKHSFCDVRVEHLSQDAIYDGCLEFEVLKDPDEATLKAVIKNKSSVQNKPAAVEQDPVSTKLKPSAKPVPATDTKPSKPAKPVK